jgi:2'-5' RNA ligase
MQDQVQFHRLFIAIQPPEDVKTAIEKAQAELRRAASGGRVRWTTREQFHLTLKFLGDVDSQRTETLAEALRGACRGFAPMLLRAEGVGFFPDPRRPRVVWGGVNEGRDQLRALQVAVEAASRDFSVQAPEKSFTGHITLGRVKEIRRPEVEALANAAAGMATRLFGEWTAEEVELVRSELSPVGARYSCVGVARLG